MNKKIYTRYATKDVNPNYYSTFKITGDSEDIKYLTKDEIKEGKHGYILVPWKSITTHVEIWDENGKIKRIRQISYWGLFKLWLHKIIYGVVKLENNNKKELY